MQPLRSLWLVSACLFVPWDALGQEGRAPVGPASDADRAVEGSSNAPTVDEESSSTAVDDGPPQGERAPSYYVTRAVSAKRRAPDRPVYVKPLSEHFADAEEWSWLDFGLQQRTRFELRDDYFRAELESESQFTMRSRMFLGLREILDPFRFAFEFQDSRRLGSDFPESTSVINEADIQQLFGELYFEDAVGEGQPLSFRAGRMSFDAVDRRLFSRNGFGNATNAFDGLRLRLGDERSVWELDMFVFRPVERLLREPDHGDDERWLFGVNGYWRGWSPHVILEPYYFLLDEDRKGGTEADGEIHTLGIHGYGLIGDSGFDYDFNAALQFGDSTSAGGRVGRHCAFAGHAEIGYTFEHEWTPRVAGWVNYASGDTDAEDGVEERFNPLFGSSHGMYGHSDIFNWRNMINPSLYASVKPTDELSVEGFYRTYWLASDRDASCRSGIIDQEGGSGRFVGQEIDLRVRYQFSERLSMDVGYAYFLPGHFIRRATDSTDDSDFFYVEMTLTF